MAARYIRVPKQDARKRYLSGNQIRMCPSRIKPDNAWGAYADMNPGRDPERREFDRLVREFEQYNCTGRETGRRAAFYIQA